jgi:hypothetical protein
MKHQQLSDEKIIDLELVSGSSLIDAITRGAAGHNGFSPMPRLSRLSGDSIRAADVLQTFDFLVSLIYEGTFQTIA